MEIYPPDNWGTGHGSFALQHVIQGPRESQRSVVQSVLAELNITNNWSTLVFDRLAGRQLIETERT